MKWKTFAGCLLALVAMLVMTADASAQCVNGRCNAPGIGMAVWAAPPIVSQPVIQPAMHIVHPPAVVSYPHQYRVISPRQSSCPNGRCSYGAYRPPSQSWSIGITAQRRYGPGGYYLVR